MTTNRGPLVRWRVPIVLLIVVALGWTAARLRAQHTIGAPVPFHLSPGDLFVVPVAGGTFSNPASVQVRFAPAAGGANVDQTSETVVANTSVSVRVPAALAGQYNISVVISGTESGPPTQPVWVRQRTFHFIERSSIHLPNQPLADFKDADFADVDNDGFLDVFEANSSAGTNVDRMQINQLGKPLDRDCLGTSDYCDQTSALSFPNGVPGLADNQRTYDADLVDLDLDADLDLVRIDRAGNAQLRVLFNSGNGTFTDRSVGAGAVLPAPATLGALASNTAMVDTGDADGDSRPDILTCDWGGGQNLLLLNRLSSSGNFVLANDNPCDPAGASAHALCKIREHVNRGCAFGDFNNDGRQDILAPAMSLTTGDRVLINTGNNASGIPQFDVRADWVKAPGGGVQDPNSGGKLKVADMDGDGDDDAVIVAPRDEQKRRILWNDNGTRLVELADDRYVPFGGGSYEVSLSDLDRDGDIDMILTFEGGTNAVLVNKGGRNEMMKFEEVPAAGLWLKDSPGGVIANPDGVTAFSLSVSAGDYDLDGDHDLVTGGFAAMKLWKNDLFDQPGEDRDWVFAQDRTRSMITGGKDFFEPSKNVLRAFLAQRRTGDLAGLVTFDYTGSDPTNPNAADDVNKAQVNFQVGVRTPTELQTDVAGLVIGSCTGQCTAIGWALKTAKEVAELSPDPLREKVVVLLTDGRQNQSPHPDTIIPTIPSNIRVYTVALGAETDDRMLSAMATNGGKFYFAGRSTDYTSMQSTMREIDEDLEGHATGKQPLLPFHALLWSPMLREVFARSPLTRAVAAIRDPVEGPRQDPTHYFVVDPSDSQVRFTLSWRGSSKTNAMTVVDPKGRTHPVAGEPGTRQRRDDKSHVIEIKDPLSGVWQVREQVTGGSGPSKITATTSSALRLNVAPSFPLFYVNEPLVWTVRLSEAIPGVQAQAQLLSPSKVSQTITGQVRGQEIEMRTPALTEPGTYRIELVAVGPSQRPFVRHYQSAVHVAEPVADEPDLRNAELTLDRNVLQAGSGTAEATLTLKRRDGAPLTGAAVSFVPELGTMTGAVQDLGGGRYRQTVTAGRAAGHGVLRARVGIVRLPNEAAFTITTGAVDPKNTPFWLIIGPLKLCTNEPGPFGVRLAPVDIFGNPMTGATVEIEKSAGPSLNWSAPTQALNNGAVYERKFLTPRTPGTYQFTATVNGTPIARPLAMDAYDVNSPEGRLIGCYERPSTGSGKPPWWLIWLLLLILLAVVLWMLLHRMRPATP